MRRQEEREDHRLPAARPACWHRGGRHAGVYRRMAGMASQVKLERKNFDRDAGSSNQVREKAMWMRASLIVMSTAAAMTAGCSPQPSAVAAAINDKVYAVVPASVKVKAGIVSGEVTEMKVTERVEEGSGRIASPAKLSGKLVLKNTSS